MNHSVRSLPDKHFVNMRFVKSVLAWTICLAVCILVLQCCGEANRKSVSSIPTAQLPKTELPNPIIDVYVENSGSMDGYVKGITEFEQIVYNYLSDIRISGLSDTLNLNYINSHIIPQGSDISDFIEKLEPTTFRLRGGDRRTSDIAVVLKSILSEMKENSVAIFVSDCIFSPGRGKDATQYLVNQQTGIKVAFADYLNHQADFSVMAYRCLSHFSGIYYDCNDSKTKIEEKRPFYIWIMGHKDYLMKMRKLEKSFKGEGIQNIFLASAGNVEIPYALKMGSGKFELDKKEPKTTLKRGRIGHNGKFSFAVDMDCSRLLLDDSYIVDNTHYEMNHKDFDLEISKAKNSKYTHTLQFSSDRVVSCQLLVGLKMQIPAWAEECNDDNGIGINSSTMDKTFGIKYLIGGVYDAFSFKTNSYTTVKLNINN